MEYNEYEYDLDENIEIEDFGGDDIGSQEVGDGHGGDRIAVAPEQHAGNVQLPEGSIPPILKSHPEKMEGTQEFNHEKLVYWKRMTYLQLLWH